MIPIKKVYGPYMSSTGSRRIVIVIYADGSKKTMANARFLLSQKLGRDLTADEEADHIDEDSLNDDPSNLQVLTPQANKVKSAVAPDLYHFTCPVCGSAAVKLLRNVKSNLKKGRSGPYCSRRCAGKVHH